MTGTTEHIDYQLQVIKSLIPSGKNAQDYLAQSLDEQIVAVSGDTAMGVVFPPTLSPVQVYASARTAVELLDDPQQLAAKPEGIVDLEVIEWLLRPALPLQQNQFQQIAAGPWQQLSSDLVASLAQSVCRLDLAISGYLPIHLGTGFIAGEDAHGRLIIVTNAHVVEAALQYGWSTNNSLSLACDFARFSVTTGGPLLQVDQEYHLHSKYDLATLYLQNSHQGNQRNLHALTIAGSPPTSIIGSRIGVLGHPSFNSALDPFPKRFGFGDAYGVKRFSPGYIRAMEQRDWRHILVDVLLHDATTLSGSSGSCIIDLESMKVIGLHFGGWPKPPAVVSTSQGDTLATLFEANGAVPLWTLVDDKALAGVTFG